MTPDRTFFAQEVIKVWKSLAGVLKHLAVLKYMQLAQKHKRFATQTFSVKVGHGTARQNGQLCCAACFPLTFFFVMRLRRTKKARH